MEWCCACSCMYSIIIIMPLYGYFNRTSYLNLLIALTHLHSCVCTENNKLHYGPGVIPGCKPHCKEVKVCVIEIYSMNVLLSFINKSWSKTKRKTVWADSVLHGVLKYICRAGVKIRTVPNIETVRKAHKKILSNTWATNFQSCTTCENRKREWKWRRKQKHRHAGVKTARLINLVGELSVLYILYKYNVFNLD